MEDELRVLAAARRGALLLRLTAFFFSNQRPSEHREPQSGRIRVRVRVRVRPDSESDLASESDPESLGCGLAASSMLVPAGHALMGWR